MKRYRNKKLEATLKKALDACQERVETCSKKREAERRKIPNDRIGV